MEESPAEGGAPAVSAEDPAEAVEVQRPKVARKVSDPTAQELEEHLATAHAVHRSWCGHCMRARATYAKHSSVSRDEDSEIPVVSIDYFYYLESQECYLSSLLTKKLTCSAEGLEDKPLEWQEQRAHLGFIASKGAI